MSAPTPSPFPQTTEQPVQSQPGPAQHWTQLPPHMQIPAQRQAPPVATAPVARPRTGLKVACGVVAGLLVGVLIGSAGSTQAASANGTAALPVQPAREAPALPAGPRTSFTDGTYEIGADVVPGKYKTPGPADDNILGTCYMEVGDGTSGIGGILENDNLTGPGVVTLPKGKIFKVKGNCTWTRVG